MINVKVNLNRIKWILKVVFINAMFKLVFLTIFKIKMKYFYCIYLIVSVLGVSCNHEKQVSDANEKPETQDVSKNRIVGSVSATLIPTAKKAVEHWKEYQTLDAFLIKYYNISNEEALSNAQELSELVKLMKDSMRVEKIKQLTIIARLNVLENEALRLADMATISTISNEEVKEEVAKILELYEAVNSKINTIYKVEELQNLLEVDTEIPQELPENFPIQKDNKFKPKISSKKQ